jgi:hypothetical protein
MFKWLHDRLCALAARARKLIAIPFGGGGPGPPPGGH